MLEKPILFNAPMVRAVLDGSKTQTRRVVKVQPSNRYDYPKRDHKIGYFSDDEGVNLYACITSSGGNAWEVKCPYGQVGDQLWVRETFNHNWCEHPIYKADGGSAIEAGYSKEPTWTPSIHMPRKYSRIQLEITKVRIERLNDINEAEALAEGVIAEPCDHVRRSCTEIGCYGDTAKGAYQWLWESINGVGSWAANPWVWLIEFKKIEAITAAQLSNERKE